MGSLLALLSSVLWGTADYLAGNLSKRFKALAVTGVSQVFGLIFGVSAILLFSDFISPNLSMDGYFLPGIIAGIAGFIGELLAELLAAFRLAVAPAPVHAGGGKFRISHHLGHSLARQRLAHVAAGDVLLEPGEDLLERLGRVAKQGRVGHAAGVERAEHDPG